MVAMTLRRLLFPLLALAAAVTGSAAPEKWAATIDKLVQADRSTPPAPGGIVFVGSSSIVKWTSLKQDFPGLNVLNRGFGGSELNDSAFYAERLVVPLHPRVVVLYAGENDLQAGKTVESVHEAFRLFCARVHSALPQARIVFISIKPSPSRMKIHGQVKAANQLIAQTCAADPRLVYADVHRLMLDAAGNPRPELFVKDQLHLNADGYALWTPVIAPLLRP
jgi:lysophospholipase L1-like esterase